MITTMIPIGMTASAETASTWIIEDFKDLSDCSVSGLNGQTTETVEGSTVVTGTSTGIGFSKTIKPAISITDYDVNYLALKMKFYIEDPTAIKTAGSPQIELTSSGKCDVNELHWVFTTLSLKAGWNDLILDFSKGVPTGGTLDITNINYMRIYANFTKEIKAGFGPMEIIATHGGADFDGSFAIVKEDLSAPPQSVEAWVKPNNYAKDQLLITDFDGSDAIPVTDSGSNTKVYTVDGGASVLSCNVPAGQWISLRHETMPSTAGITLPAGYGMNELAISFRVYVDDVTKVNSVNIELANTRMDTNEIFWNLDSLTAAGLKNGWNEFVLPFSSGHGPVGGEFTVSKIKWWRFNFSNTADGANVYKVDYLKILPLRADNSVLITDFDNTDILAITDSCGANTKTYTTDNGASVLNITTTGDQWFSLRQEGLPSTAGLSLPADCTAMDQIAVALRVYIEDVTAIKTANLELANTRMDTNEISWDLAGINAVQPLQNGWNELVLPFSTRTGNTNGEFTLAPIKWWRFNFNNTTGGANTYKLDYIKIIPLNQDDSQSPEAVTQQRNYLFSYSDTADRHQGLFVDQNGLLYWLDGENAVGVGAYLAPNEWSHVAYTLDPATKILQVLINGQLSATKTLTADSLTQGTFRVGVGPDVFNGGAFSGKIGDVRVWTDIRTETEIANNYQILINTATEGLYANWRLNEDMGFVSVVPQDAVGVNHATILWRDWSDWIPYEETENYDYTFVAVPDPQILAALYPDVYYKLFQYIADNAESQKIEYVLGLGDITNSNSEAEWKVARKAFDYIEGKVPYANVLGNHDYGDWTLPYRDTTRYNNYFKYADHSARSDWGGAYEEGKLDNAYYCFDVGNVPYMVVCLEFLPRDGALAWANQVVAAHPERNVIVLTHGYIDGGSGNIGSEPQSDYGFIINNPDPYNGGQKIWQKFISQHENIVMSLCGHTFCKDDNVIMRTDAGVNGNTVIQLCLNAQTMDEAYFDKTGVGMLGLLRFSENGQKVALQYYSPHTNRCFREVNQKTFTLGVKSANMPYEKDGVLYVNDCEALQGWSTAYATQVNLDKQDKTQGESSLTMIGTKPTENKISDTHYVGAMAFYDFPSPADLTGYDTISFDYYLSEDMTGKVGQLQLNFATNGEDGYNTLLTLDGKKAGWHTATFATNENAFKVTDFDWANINKLRYTWWNLNQSVPSMTVKLDNLRFYNAAAQQEEADKAAAKVVENQIEGLDVQSLDDKSLVEAARTAYNALTDAQKAYVPNLAKLEAAEAKIAEWEAAATIKYGDVDGDDRVSATDALEVLKSVVGNVTLTEEQTVLADVDGDEKISSADALYILKKVVGKIDKFPVEE